MKYEKAQNILPQDIIELIQQYMDGGYLYIPRKSESKKSWGENSGIKSSLKKRNNEIYNKYSSGVSVKDLSKQFYLTEESIRRIIRGEKQLI
ncbi:CD3324 family protein [Clostridium weizhouense]|uniref:DNA-binding response regulator n=1 Tax=Clostridium weizhouense TaxID=2859781 RepID=A0ABS7ATN2_9CLOT|nr:CD3324 family protein [Clostridium weizhouense]MBW6410865.1 DNA-binding response regulator [Clostridium weizhouense]